MAFFTIQVKKPDEICIDKSIQSCKLIVRYFITISSWNMFRVKKKKDFILSLYQSKESVFTIDEIAIISGDTNRQNLKSKLNYYSKKGELRNVRKGIYTKLKYDSFELATKIFRPSYISLETVLQKEGVIFQIYKTIFVISYLSRKIKVDFHEIQYRRIKENFLLNPNGVTQKPNYAVATKERAFLDLLYLYKDYYFDNLDALEKETVFALLDIYHSKALSKKVREIFKNA